MILTYRFIYMGEDHYYFKEIGGKTNFGELNHFYSAEISVLKDE